MAGFNWRSLIGLGGPDNTPGSTGLGPDFPESAGGREQGKFRPAQYPRLTTVAVSNDDGSTIADASNAQLSDILTELRMLRVAMVAAGTAEEVLPEEVSIND